MAGNWHRIGNISGRDGVGVPQGGAQGEVLVKEGGSDFATSWRKPRYEDIEGMVPASALPQISNEPYVINSQAAMLNLPAVPGRMAIRTDQGKTYILSELPASTLSNWIELTTTSDVQSVNGKTGNVTVTKADVGLDKVNNTADADKPQATTSTPGLMPAADKTKLNNATAAATASRMVIRDANARASFRQVNLSDMPSSNGHAATKAYVDDEVNRLIAGRTPLSGSAMATNWDNLGNTSQAAVVEGFPIGAPVARAGVFAVARWIISPVWEVKHESLGLNYRKQSVKLLSADPAYMIGFSWERYYHPGQSRWSDWQCTGGDTGEIKSFPFSQERTRDDVFCHREDSYLYVNSKRHTFRRTGSTIHAWGEMTVPPSARGDLASTRGAKFGWLTMDDHMPVWGIWGTSHINMISLGVMQGSNKSRWSLQHRDGANHADWFAARYGEDDPSASGSVWLPFRVSYDAPPVLSFRGTGA